MKQKSENNLQEIEKELQCSPHKQTKIDPTKPLKFEILQTQGKARSSIMTLPHGEVQTPVYMPVGTKGTIKGLTSYEMELLDCKILLGNTYHLAFYPGKEFFAKHGGFFYLYSTNFIGVVDLHEFMNWKRNILTDSGGFQMVSLSKLSEVTEEGVKFESPEDHSEMFLRPEDSIQTQNSIGADIMMALDDVVKTTTEGPRMGEACDRTLRWIDRCINAHENKEKQNLFPIIQGGLDFELRKKCIEEMSQKQANGFAIGGLAGGEDKEDFWRIVNLCTDLLPKNKPRYLMGVGYPVDLVVCSCLGVDMFDCVFSTRTARFGAAFTSYGMIKLTKQEFAGDMEPIEEGCQCQTCQCYTKSYLHLIVKKEEVACHLISYHNLYYLLNLMKSIRIAIEKQELNKFVEEFLKKQFKSDEIIPKWICNALTEIKLKMNIYNLNIQ